MRTRKLLVFCIQNKLFQSDDMVYTIRLHYYSYRISFNEAPLVLIYFRSSKVQRLLEVDAYCKRGRVHIKFRNFAIVFFQRTANNYYYEIYSSYFNYFTVCTPLCI